MNRRVIRVCAFIEGRGVVVAYQSAMARKPEPAAVPVWIAAAWARLWAGSIVEP